MSMLPFAIVDVFASAPLQGNPLAVVLGADRLPDHQLRRIAGEFNQPETTFVLAPRFAKAAFRLRSFTASGAEVSGAGHNALGALWWLAGSLSIPSGGSSQEIGGELLAVAVTEQQGRLMVAIEQHPPWLGTEVNSGSLCAPLGIAEDQLAREAARVISTGAPHLLVPARDQVAVDAARPDQRALLGVLADAGAQGCYLYARTSGRRAERAYARFFNPTIGLSEDAATGSAAAPLAWWLVSRQRGAGHVRIHQGHSLGRPSEIDVIVDGDRVILQGSAVLTAEGVMHIDDQEEPDDEPSPTLGTGAGHARA